MKISTYDKYKWFLFGASIASDEYFWKGNGNKNKNIKTELSDDRHVLRLRAEEENND